MSEFLFNFIGFTLLGAVAVVLIMGIYTLFKGGNTSKKYSNKFMQLRVLLQFIAIIVLVGTGFHGLGVPYALSISAWVLAILGVITTLQRLIIVKRAI